MFCIIEKILADEVYLTFCVVMVGKLPAQVIRRQSRPCMSEQISEVVGYVYRAQPAALGQGVHEGMFPYRFLTPYVQAIPKREFIGLNRCSDRLLDISATPDFRILDRWSH